MPTILLATSTIAFGNSTNRDYLYFSNYLDPRISALQNELFSYRSLSVVTFISDFMSMS